MSTPAAKVERALARALRELHRACEAAVLYAPHHDVVVTAARDAARSFAKGLTAREPISLRVLPDGFAEGDTPLPPSAELASLAARLHELDVASIELGRGISARDVRGLVGILAGAGSAPPSGKALAVAVEKATKGRVRVQPMQFGSLRLVDGERATGGGDEQRWTEIVGALSRGGADTCPQALAASAAAAIGDGGHGVGPLREELQELAVQLEELPEGTRVETLNRVQAFVKALSPDLRESLLRIDPVNPETSIAMLVDLADVLPTAEVIDALENLDHAARRPSREALMLFRKLTRIAEHRPSCRDRLSGVTEEWCDIGTNDLRLSLEEIFQQRRDGEFSPDDYQAHLDRLTRREATQQSRPAFSAVEERLHSAGIAIRILGTDTVDECGPLFEHLGAVLDEMLDARRFEQLAEAGEIAERYARRFDDDQARASAQHYRDRLAAPATIRRLLNAIVSGECCEAAARLVTLAGLPGLRATLDELVRSEDDAERNALDALLRGAPLVLLECLAREAASDDVAIAGQLVRVIDGLPIELRGAVLAPILRHPDARVRVAVLRYAADRSVPMDADVLSEALRDEDEEVAARALACFETADTGDPSDDLARIVSESIGAGDDDEPVRRTVDRLVTLPGGPDRLKSLLAEAGRRGRRSPTGRYVAERLAATDEHAEHGARRSIADRLFGRASRDGKEQG